MLSDNLLIASQVTAAASACGLVAEHWLSADDLARRGAAVRPAVVLLDLSLTGIDLEQLVSKLRTEAAPRVLAAFGPHVHAGLLERAAQLGCDPVLARGQLLARLPEWLRAWIPPRVG